ncbi:MAG: helix-hairpin-helix domain-containing protein, partial [Bacteroidota bacterium]
LGLWASLLVKWHYNGQAAYSPAEDVARLEQVLAQLARAHKKEQPRPTPRVPPPAQRSAQHAKPFDINQASQTQLLTVSGMNAVLSARTIKYRDKLGGFVHPSQYTEVYGLTAKTARALRERSYIKQGFQPRRINVNRASVKVLVAHPYLTYKQAQRIIRYRAQHGPYATVEALHERALIDKRILARVKCYLAVS